MERTTLRPLSLDEAKAQLRRVTAAHNLASFLHRHAHNATLTALVAGMLVGMSAGPRRALGRGLVSMLMKLRPF